MEQTPAYGLIIPEVAFMGACFRQNAFISANFPPDLSIYATIRREPFRRCKHPGRTRSHMQASRADTFTYASILGGRRHQ